MSAELTPEPTTNSSPMALWARLHHTVRWGLIAAVVVSLGALAVSFAWWTSVPLLEIHHAPQRFERRTADLSANICGQISRWAQLRYRLNGGEWVDVVQEAPRVPAPNFTIELPAQRLMRGENQLELEASADGGRLHREQLVFDHDPSPAPVPRVVDWSGELDVQDGHWEVTDVGGERRARPVPGSEGYDRILLVTGAFPAARRVETEVVFRSFCADQIWAGFGVLPLWGGHLDEPGRRPRRGWLYGVAWFMKPYGPWCEFSVKRGDQARHDTFAGRTTIEPQPGTRFRIIAECWPETSPLGGHVRYRQRAKIWPMDQPEPRDWIECAEQGGARLPERDYAVALLAHQCQVEFGPVRVLPLPGGSR